MKLKTVLTIAAVVFFAWWIIMQPDSAQHLVHDAGAVLDRWAAVVPRFASGI